MISAYCKIAFLVYKNVLMYWTQILSEICHQSYCEKQQCFHFSSRGHMRKRQKDAHSFMSYHLIPVWDVNLHKRQLDYCFFFQWTHFSLTSTIRQPQPWLRAPHTVHQRHERTSPGHYGTTPHAPKSTDSHHMPETSKCCCLSQLINVKVLEFFLKISGNIFQKKIILGLINMQISIISTIL